LLLVPGTWAVVVFGWRVAFGLMVPGGSADMHAQQHIALVDIAFCRPVAVWLVPGP
jgi:hypothetical protein